MSKRILNGSELQGFIKARQARQVAGLGFVPRLVIITVGDDEVGSFYTKVKKSYGEDIGVEVEGVGLGSAAELGSAIEKANEDDKVSGIIVQLPIAGLDGPQAILNLIAPKKDVDGLGGESGYISATATAILWLLNGYNVQLEQGSKIVIVGRGKLVGAPLFNTMQDSGYNVESVDEFTENRDQIINEADVVVSAAGVPGLITQKLIKQDAVVVDAGTASVNGGQVGDVASDVYERDDLTTTPEGGRGGVGPLTVAALFDNVIIASQNSR